MSSIDDGRPSAWNSAGTRDPNWERKSGEMRGAFDRAGKSAEKDAGGADNSRAGDDKAAARHDREPSQAELKQGAALDTRNSSRARFEAIRTANAQRGMSRGMDLSR